MTLRELRDHKTAAHIAPLVIFMALMLVPQADFVRWDHPSAPWWRRQPEQWVYPLQTAVCLGLLGFWWRQYTFRPFGVRAATWGVVVGAVGIAIWLLPGWLHLHHGWSNRWLGAVDRSGPGFDPSIFADGSGAWWASVIGRFARMTVAVPFVEEVFWRGFLWRYVAAAHGRWESVPVGVRSARAIGVTSLLMMVSHHPSDWAVCLVWSLLVSLVAVRTRSLGACVLCHAVSNLLLGLYIMAFRQWGLW